MVLELIPTLVWYALLGASVREAWGIWRAYETFLSVKLIWKRILITWAFAWFFGIVGGEILLSFGIFALGINLAAFFCGILSGNSINYFAKKMGFAQKLEVPVSEQQLQPDLNPRQVNALYVAKKQGKVTNKVHQKMNATTRHIASRDLNKLVSEGRLLRVGRGKGTYYVTARYAPHMPRENMRNSVGHK